MKTLISIVTIVGVLFWGAVSLTAQKQQDNEPVDVGALWNKSCATCHGKDGRSKTLKGRLKGARDLTDSIWQDSVTDQRIGDSIKLGKDGGMPAFGKKLSDDEIEALVGYVRLLGQRTK